MANEIAEKVKRVVIKTLDVKEDEVTETSSFVDDLGADSLDTVELVMALEDEFGIEIEDERAEQITTVADAIRFISENKE
jgi:acyl carrier protein